MLFTSKKLFLKIEFSQQSKETDIRILLNLSNVKYGVEIELDHLCMLAHDYEVAAV
jgi:hypothetical protein